MKISGVKPLKKKILVVLFLSALSIQCAVTACWQNHKKQSEIIPDNTTSFYYIRARDYKKPSNRVRTEAGKVLIEAINSAENTIDFAFYGLSQQNEILNALLKAQKRGVKIRGIIDLNTYGKNDYFGTIKSISKFKKGIVKTDYKSDIAKKERLKNNKSISFSNQNFKGHIMHNKFCIIDKKYVWTGTANISSTGTGGYNENVVLLINSEKIADIYTQEMDEMYENEHFHEDKREIYTPNPIFVGDVETSVYFSPTTHAFNEGIIPVIKNAKKYIYVSIFLISNRKIKQELIDAKARGVDVKVITEANHAKQKYSLHEKMRDANIPVKVENWGGKMHSKMAIIDDNTVIIGSTNWSSTAFYHNDENLLILKNTPQNAIALRKEFEQSYNNIPDKWLYENPNPEGPDSIGSCEDGIDNDHNRLVDRKDPNCKPKYLKLINKF
ncbi:hypothetical protein IJV79_04980 [bacterium]|nr:hypothetical protein [bacterium]